MTPTSHVVVVAFLLSIVSACATPALDAKAGRRDGLLLPWHMPELGIAWSQTSYGQTTRTARDLAVTDASQLQSPATILSIDQSDPWPSNEDFAFSLKYDLTPYITLEANYHGNSMGGGADATLLDGANAFLNGTIVRQNGSVQPFGSQAAIDTQWYGAALLGYWPVWRGLNLMARAGLEHTRTEVSTQFSAGHSCLVANASGALVEGICGDEHSYSHYSDARNLPQIGVGIAYRLKDFGRVTVEYDRLANVGNSQMGRYSVNTIIFEVSLSPSCCRNRYNY